MAITVEFFGIPRLRAGVSSVQIDAASIGEAFDRLAPQFPRWADECLADGRLKPVYLANLNARTFVADRSHPLKDGDHLLILAADIGG